MDIPELEPETREMLLDIVVETEDSEPDWLGAVLRHVNVRQLGQEYSNAAGLLRVPYMLQVGFCLPLA